MAKITPSQAEAIKAKGLDPDSISRVMSQDRIDKLFPASEAVTPAPQVAIPATVTKPVKEPTPIIVKPKTQIVVPTPAQALPIAVPPATPASEVGTKVPGYLNMQELANQLVASRSTLPTGGIDVEQEKKSREMANAILNQPFTLGGTPSPITAPFAADVKTSKETGFEGLKSALKPQTIMTPAQAEAETNKERLATMDAVTQLEREYLDAAQYYDKLGQTDQANAARLAQKKLMEPGDILLKPDLLQRKNYLVDWMNEKEAALQAGQPAPAFNPPKYSEAGVGDLASELGSKALKKVMTNVEPGGKIVESTPAYAFRMLSAPVSGMVGAVEAAVTDKTIGETVPERIREGAGVMGVGIDVGSSIADSMGYTEEAAKTDNQIAGKRTAIIAMSGALGLAGDFFLPIVPGSDIAGVAGKAGAEAFQVEKALGTATGGALKAGIKQAGKAAVAELPLASKWVPFEYGKDAFSKGIANYATNGTNVETMSTIVKMGDTLKEEDAFAKWEKLGYDDKTKVLEAAYLKTGATKPFAEFTADAAKITDIYDVRNFKDIDSNFTAMTRRAVLDTALSADSKASLATGSALSSDKLMNDLVQYLTKSGDENFVKNIPQMMQRIGETAFRLPKTGSAIKTIDKAALEALSKQYLQDAAVRKLTTKYMEGPTQMAGLPNYSRITKTSFLPVSETQKVIKEVSASPIGAIKSRIYEAASKGEAFVPVTLEEVQKINDLLGTTPLIGAQATDVVNDINKLFIQTPTGFKLQVSDWNGFVEKALDAYASTKAGYKNIFDVNKDLQAVSTAAKGGEKYVPTAAERITKEQYYQKVLTPKEVAGGTFESVLTGSAKKAIEGSAPQSYSLLSTEFTDAVGQRFGSIPDDFRSIYKNNRASGLTAPEAWSKTLVDNYNRQAIDIMDRLKLEGRMDEAAEIFKGNSQQMFDDYMAMIFGGYESMIEAINTTGRSQFLDNMLIAPFEMRQLVFVASQNPMIKSLKEEFVALVAAGRNDEALVVLRNAHALTQGKSLKTFVGSEKALEEYHKAAVAADKYGILKKGTGTVYKTERAFQGERGIFEMWNYGGETAPMFFVDNHLELLSSQYMTRRQSAIISEVYKDWEKIYPELFPSSEGININASRYADAILTAPEELFAAKFYNRVLEGKVGFSAQDKAQIIADYKQARPSRAAWLSDADILKEHYEGMANQYAEAATSIAKIALQDKDLTRKLYIALVEDSLTRLSASEQQANRFFNVAKESKQSSLDKVAKAMGKNKKDLKQTFDMIYEDLFLSKDAYPYHATISNSNDYIHSIYPRLRAETTPLFYDTLKTSIRNAASNNMAVLTRGALEQTQTIPLIFGETAAIKGALRRRGGIDEFTKTMEDLKISSDVRKLPPGTEFSKDLKEAVEQGLDATTSLRGIADKKIGPMKRLTNIAADIFGTLEAGFNDSRMAAYAKGGVLGGQILPNFRYLTTNYITAPAIIYMQLGGKYALESLKTGSMFDLKTNSVMKALLGMDTPGATPIFAAPLDVRLGGGKVKPEVVVTTPAGKVYTNYDIARMITDGGVARSEASAELTKKVVEDVTSYAGVRQSELLKADVKGLNNIPTSQVKQLIVEAYGMPLAGGKRGMNIFSEWAANTDTMYRAGVLRKALEEGLSEEQALQLARESLFDYGNLSDFEKKVMNRAFWFWTFRRNSYRSVLKAAMTNPSRLRNTYLANNFVLEMDRDNNIATQDYAALRPFIHLVDDAENKQRFALYGPGIPALSATAELLDYMSVVPLIVNDKKDFKDSLTSAYTVPLLAYAKNATPAVQTAIGLSFGIDPRRDAKELGYYLDPRLMWYMQQSPQAWSTFQSLVTVEVVPANEEVPGRGTYQGRQWRIKKGDDASVRNWFAIQQALLYVGLDRNLGDYAPLFEEIAGSSSESDLRDFRLGGEGSGTLMNMMYSGGVVTPIEAVTIQDRIELNKRVVAEELKKNTYDTKR